MTNTFAVYIAEKPYHVPELHDEWRRHRFLMLANKTQGQFKAVTRPTYNPDQELHYVRMKTTGLFKAMVFPQGRVRRSVDEVTLSRPILCGTEYDVRGQWNRALATAFALNHEDHVFADVKTVTQIDQLYTCDAGLQAGFDAMGITYDFGRAGKFKTGLYDSVADQVPALDPTESLEGRGVRSDQLMKEIQRTRVPMKAANGDAPALRRVG